jgi:S1-C subfamily serine protease
MRRFGFLFSLAVLSASNAVAQNGPPLSIHIYAPPSHYSVGGLALGEKVALGSAARQGYQCADSKKFEEFAWCTKKSSEREARGTFKVWMSLMLGPDSRVAYVNRYQEPAYWGANEIKDDIQRYSKKVNQEPRIIHMPTRPGLPKGTLATWGDVVLEPIVGDELNVLAGDKPLPKGIAIDFIGDFTKSARQGLPIYRLSGGAGFVWAASYNEAGRGTLRFVAVDASTYTPQPVQWTPRSRPEPKSDEVYGTGFFVTSNRVLTNFHVIEGCSSVILSVPGAPSDVGRVAATDPSNDLALIALNGTNTLQPSLIPALRNRPQLGEAAFAYGYPLPGLLSRSGNFTSGSVSSLSGLGDDISRVQISTPVQPGNSGGPLLDTYGNVIGVVVGKLVARDFHDSPQNVNFAIKASVAMSFLEANNVNISLDPTHGTALQATDVAERAKQFSVQVVCRR